MDGLRGFDGRPKRFIHFAPETAFVPALRCIPGLDYLSVDLDSPHAMARMDITCLELADDSCDALYCSHVLEHVPDDRTAMQEMLRVLKPGGWVAIQVPISAQPTREDPSVTDPRERERLFGQHDHVRSYGLDVGERLQAVGFVVTRIHGQDLESPEMCAFQGFRPNEVVFLCTKPSRDATGEALGCGNR